MSAYQPKNRMRIGGFLSCGISLFWRKTSIWISSAGKILTGHNTGSYWKSFGPAAIYRAGHFLALGAWWITKNIHLDNVGNIGLCMLEKVGNIVLTQQENSDPETCAFFTKSATNFYTLWRKIHFLYIITHEKVWYFVLSKTSESWWRRKHGSCDFLLAAGAECGIVLLATGGETLAAFFVRERRIIHGEN